MPRISVTEKDVAAFAEEIKEYLIIHPNAADSLEGIVKWWLGRQRWVQAVDKVEKALEYLVVQGAVKKVITADGKEVYLSAAQKSERTH